MHENVKKKTVQSTTTKKGRNENESRKRTKNIICFLLYIVYTIGIKQRAYEVFATKGALHELGKKNSTAMI